MQLVTVGTVELPVDRISNSNFLALWFWLNCISKNKVADFTEAPDGGEWHEALDATAIRGLEGEKGQSGTKSAYEFLPYPVKGHTHLYV